MAKRNVSTAKNASAVIDADSISQITAPREVVIGSFRFYVKELPGLWGYSYHRLEEGEEKTKKLAEILMYCVIKKTGEPLFASTDEVSLIPAKILNGLIEAIILGALDDDAGSKVTDPKESNPILTSVLPTD